MVNKSHEIIPFLNILIIMACLSTIILGNSTSTKAVSIFPYTFELADRLGGK